MKNAIRTLGFAVIATIIGITMAACDDETVKTLLAPTFTSIDELGEWLSNQPDNTAATAYKDKLNVNDISTLKATLDAAENKYVSLDLSGSTLTTIHDYAFNTGEPDYTGCATLTGIIIPSRVTGIRDGAFDGCTSLASVTFQGTIPSSGLGNDPNFPTFPGDLRDKYLAGGAGRYTRQSGSEVWTKQS